MKSKRSQACDISPKVKQEVWERDNHRCIICGSPLAAPNAHYIPRSAGGLGIPENIVTLCTNFSPNRCHYRYDFGSADDREQIGQQIEDYLRGIYPDWDPEKLVYKKYDF